jgi:hypothetical protein
VFVWASSTLVDDVRRDVGTTGVRIGVGAPQHHRAMPSEPWFVNDPEIAAAVRAAVERFTGGPVREPRDDHAYVVAEFFDNACWRELGAVREDLIRVRARRDAAVRAARRAGYSWAEIGRVLGVSRQSLHRRYGGAME